MIKTVSEHLVYWMLAASLLIPVSVCAQQEPAADKAQEAKVADLPETPDTGDPGLKQPGIKVEPVEIKRDPSFERYVNRGLLNRAMRSLDPKLLTDVALQFFQGERVLFRSHNSISASEVLGFALKAATAKGDQESLDRLAKAVDQLGNEELAAQVKAAQQLSSGSRAIDPAFSVSVQMSTRAYALYQSLLQSIEAAKLRGDSLALTRIRDRLPNMELLGEPERRAIERLLTEALETVPEDGNDVAEKLARLSSVSRAKLAQVAIDPRLYGVWMDGGHMVAIGKTGDMTASYSQKASGQEAVKRVLDATDKAHVYRLKTTGSEGIYLNFTFDPSGQMVTVKRYDGSQYVAYGTWKKRAQTSARPAVQ